MKPKVCITQWMDEEYINLLRNACEVVVGPDYPALSTGQIAEIAHDADALVCSVSDRIDETLLAQCPRLRLVASFGKGCDNLDVEACTARGIWVTVIPNLLTEPTADLAVGLMLSLCRRIPAGDAYVRTGQPPAWHPRRLLGQNLYGKTLGIVGMGAIGRAVARRVLGFDMRILYHDPVPLAPNLERELDAAGLPLEELLKEADIVLLSLPLTRETFQLMDRSRLRLLKPSALLVNVARGSLVDEEAVAEALSSHRLAGYATDVFAAEEQRESGHQSGIPAGLLGVQERTVLTPHLGTATETTRKAVFLAVVRNVLVALKGDRPPGAINSVFVHGQ